MKTLFYFLICIFLFTSCACDNPHDHYKCCYHNHCDHLSHGVGCYDHRIDLILDNQWREWYYHDEDNIACRPEDTFYLFDFGTYEDGIICIATCSTDYWGEFSKCIDIKKYKYTYEVDRDVMYIYTEQNDMYNLTFIIDLNGIESGYANIKYLNKSYKIFFHQQTSVNYIPFSDLLK
jgi:hypothetical protein